MSTLGIRLRRKDTDVRLTLSNVIEDIGENVDEDVGGDGGKM